MSGKSTNMGRRYQHVTRAISTMERTSWGESFFCALLRLTHGTLA